jgi:hypothetical protein
MKKSDANKIREIQKSLSVKFEHDEMTPQDNMARLKALRLAKEAADKAVIQNVAAVAARIPKPRA